MPADNDHSLVDDTLRVERGGIVAECICGWRSREHFSRLSASAAFEDHKANAPDDNYLTT